MTKVESGNTVSVHYCGTLNDGTEFDSSYNRGEPITFEVGAGQMISGFDSAVVGMAVGEEKNINIAAAQAYGVRNEEHVQDVPITSFPQDYEFVEGTMVQGQQPNGQTFLAKIVGRDTHTVKLDFNHPLAGQDLNFKIELMNIA